MRLGSKRSWTQLTVSAVVVVGLLVLTESILGYSPPLAARIPIVLLSLCGWVFTGFVMDWWGRRR